MTAAAATVAATVAAATITTATATAVTTASSVCSLNLTKHELRTNLRRLLKKISLEKRSLESIQVNAKLLEMKEYKNAKSIAAFLPIPNQEIDLNNFLQQCFKDQKKLYLPKCLDNGNMIFLEIFNMSDIYNNFSFNKRFQKLKEPSWYYYSSSTTNTNTNTTTIMNPYSSIFSSSLLEQEQLLSSSSKKEEEKEKKKKEEEEEEEEEELLKNKKIIKIKRKSALECLDLDLMIIPGLGFTNQGARIGYGMGHYDKFFEMYRTKLLQEKKKLQFYTTNNNNISSSSSSSSSLSKSLSSLMITSNSYTFPFTVGVGLSCQLLDYIPVERHDYNLDCVVTPELLAEDRGSDLDLITI